MCIIATLSEMKILEARFKVSISREEYEKTANPKKYAEMAGLKWKIYAFDDEKSMATGIYLFEDINAMEAQMESLRQAGEFLDFVSDLELQVWDVQDALCKITGAPI